VRVDVGNPPKLQIFDVHIALITERSDFFKKALIREWKEAAEKVVKLPDDDPEVFAIYLHHLYTGELAVKPEEQYYAADDYVKTYQDFAHLYVFAEKVQDIGTKNAVIRAMLDAGRIVLPNRANICPGSNIIRIIYKGTPAGCPARRLLVDFWTYRAVGVWFKSSDLHVEFMQDLLARVMDVRAAPHDPTKNETGSEYMEVKKEKAQ
jgi:hypothetical protein